MVYAIKMKVHQLQLESILRNHVCDIRFVRRRPERDRPPTRRMICTKSYNLLNSVDGRTKLNYRPATHPIQVSPMQNLVVVWDILMQDYRNVSMEHCEIIQQIPEEEFWKYYNEVLYPMSPNDKINLMNS